MEKNAVIKIKNLNISDVIAYQINDYFTISHTENETEIIATNIDKLNTESSPTLLKSALDCAFPQMVVSTQCSASPSENYYKSFWKSNVLFSYYGQNENIKLPSFSASRADLDKLKKWHHMIIEHNNLLLSNKSLRSKPWNISYNEYLAASNCVMIEKGFTNLITALEALLVESKSELSYRVSLYTSLLCGENLIERRDIFNTIKKCYDYRSKMVHGDLDGLKKFLGKSEVLDLFIKLKKIVSQVLYCTYSHDKKSIIQSVESSLYNAPIVILGTEEILQ